MQAEYTPFVPDISEEQNVVSAHRQVGLTDSLTVEFTSCSVPKKSWCTLYEKGIIEAFSQGFTKQINLAAFLAVWKGIHIASSYSLLWQSESSNGPLWKVAFIFQLQEHVSMRAVLHDRDVWWLKSNSHVLVSWLLQDRSRLVDALFFYLDANQASW